MSALFPAPKIQVLPMSREWLDAVVALENQLYTHPWSLGNFADSINSGYQAQVLTLQLADDSPPHLIGYLIAMLGVDEVHLLNLAVQPIYQGQGFASAMLDGLNIWARQQGAARVWLEVRISNTRAQALYERLGYEHVSVRRSYYPAANNQREDALVMSLVL